MKKQNEIIGVLKAFKKAFLLVVSTALLIFFLYAFSVDSRFRKDTMPALLIVGLLIIIIKKGDQKI